MTKDEFNKLTKSLAATPELLRRLTDGMSDAEARWKPSTGEFSVVENVCHLRDIELDGHFVRINRILKEDQPFLPDLNGAKLADQRDYNNQDLSVGLDGFAEAREDSLRAIKGLSSEQLARSGTFENTGSISLERLLELMKEHDDAHLEELKNLRVRNLASNLPQ